MSADNYIRIRKTPDMGWEVEELTAEGVPITDLGEWADLESAIRAANAYMEENDVEFGLDIEV